MECYSFEREVDFRATNSEPSYNDNFELSLTIWADPKTTPADVLQALGNKVQASLDNFIYVIERDSMV